MRAKMGELLSFCRKAGNGFYLWLCGERYAWLLPIVLIVALLVTAWIFQYHSYDATARRLGKQGEAKVRRLLKNTKSLKKRILNDVILTVEYGNTVQIDHILINEYGVFVIETKNFKGVVYGTEGKNYWRQYLKNKSFTFYSPIRQNESHIQHLKETFGKISVSLHYRFCGQYREKGRFGYRVQSDGIGILSGFL
ncbi:MAG: NERD domain-containing protein [Clostridia bacterium]|nr:NERD domain-containing protein [Clostridia bacterium]